ncbi:DUF2842 domain-containing protein [Sphingomicrobium astaxanthinifaciens]|uniref:DUF2842 domain-containing protein n=1 Tax=Sphingomicrobium astaxanthinifaciens TaxID=1227949 RepID=UPI001FCA7ECE|nr:DUF2842 domain-containing protein [Sphingomicrobium astaxanthinifaciens]MCJ7422131.1 DUF2842 domain-containing protein [Sphingomicrobium astaxanthinifaciens]
MDDPVHQPKSRVAIGMLLLLGWLAAYVVLVVLAFDLVADWPALAQMPFYLVAGLAWIAPLKPLLAWMETGHRR